MATWKKEELARENGEIVPMQVPEIISASRSTDIPAFYADWFFARLEKGYSAWTNPFNGVRSYVSYKNTRFIVFWSKNPRPLLTHLDYLKERGIGCYIQYTLNDYVAEGLEKGVPKVEERIDTFKRLVDALGKGHVIWRFDPLFLAENIREDDLLAQHTPSWIVEQLYEKASASRCNCIIESVRTPGEVAALRGKPNFYLFAVDADPKVRYERAVLRGSETDHVSYETFIANEQREMDNTDPNKQNLNVCIRQADFRFDNGGSFEDLHKQVEEVLKQITYHRPSWDEYFMELANAAARRATCDRGRSGCVIVKDKQLLVTGYVGSPSGLPHCDEVGHLFRQTIDADGHISTHCVRTVHAEQNAICQAARRGIALDGATLYCRMTPCRTCAMLIINCGIKRVVCERKYHSGAESEELFRQAGIQLEFFHDEVQQYANQ